MTRVATDVGGTFTDLVCYDDVNGSITVAKTLTTTENQSTGVLNAIEMAAKKQALRAEHVGYFVHGGTTVINALIERKGVPTALVTTYGFRDVLEIGRGNRPDLYNLQARTPPAYVPRRFRFEVRERMDAEGQIVTALNEADIAPIVERCREGNIQAIAVVFLHSYANDSHETLCADLLRQQLPDVAISTSSQISRTWREYERTNTAVLNAYVQPIIAQYFETLTAALRRKGIKSELWAMQSNGGVAPFDKVCRQPLTLVESGPSGGIAGAAHIGATLGADDILSLDVGGTTAKCSLVRDGRPQLRADYRFEWSRTNPGYPVQIPVVDIVEIGAGGGSIAWLDESGILHVGPQSAGSTPGPACYARGGASPTLTDACLITGILDPDNFANRQMSLDTEAAHAAMQPLAEALQATAEETAAAIIAIAEANMINALKLVTVQRGHDPREFSMLISGGAGPMLAARLGRELATRSTIIPLYPGIFSAWGMLAAPPKTDLRQTLFCQADHSNMGRVQILFDDLIEQAVAYFDVKQSTDLRLHFNIEARYQGQEHTVATTYTYGSTVETFLNSFHQAHEALYTFRLSDQVVEITHLHLEAEMNTDIIALSHRECPLTPAATEPKGARNVFLSKDTGWCICPVFDRESLSVHTRLNGPCLIEEATTTTLVLIGQTVSVTDTGLLVIEESQGGKPESGTA